MLEDVCVRYLQFKQLQNNVVMNDKLHPTELRDDDDVFYLMHRSILVHHQIQQC